MGLGWVAGVVCWCAAWAACRCAWRSKATATISSASAATSCSGARAGSLVSRAAERPSRRVEGAGCGPGGSPALRSLKYRDSGLTPVESVPLALEPAYSRPLGFSQAVGEVAELISRQRLPKLIAEPSECEGMRILRRKAIEGL
jgi:hypothetical protein